MCGIFCLLCNKSEVVDNDSLLKEFKIFEKNISRRGPNSLQVNFVNLETSSLLFAASVLWLQGSDITIQPLQSDKSVFLYNGDIFGGYQLNDNLSQQTGDTQLFFNLLDQSYNILETVSNLEGPFAFIYLDKYQKKLYFSRDMYGRRSLLIGKNDTTLILTSVAKRNTKYEFIEIPCTGVFCIDLNVNTWQMFPWPRRNKNFTEKVQEVENFINNTILLQNTDFGDSNNFVNPTDCKLKFLNDLSNVSPNEIFQRYCNLHLDRIVQLRELLQESVHKRIYKQPKFCQSCFKQYNCQHAITGILFSGGVDCAVLALLANTFIDKSRPIDLINVAFEKGGNYNTPDRITGLETLKELEDLCPERKWNFVAVNVTKQELDLCRKEQISDLIYPLNSVLDDSLGCALWFASRAITSEYMSPCRTLLVGMGADELFGGYTRHRAAFQRNNWKGLHDVLDEDWQNLPHRNLARDDRVVSDHGRQLRTPYLDENLVDFVRNLNSWDKTFPSKDLPQGIGEKLLLRSLAYHLGLKRACTFKKRALQFGSRIANSKEKGHQASERLQVIE